MKLLVLNLNWPFSIISRGRGEVWSFFFGGGADLHILPFLALLDCVSRAWTLFIHCRPSVT